MTNNQLHEDAVKLLLQRQRNATETTAKGVVNSYNQRRKDATANLRPVLKQIWEAFERGESVGGFHGKEDWAKSQLIGIKQIQRIIKGPKPQKRHDVVLKVGMTVVVGKQQVVLTQSLLTLLTTTPTSVEIVGKVGTWNYDDCDCDLTNNGKTCRRCIVWEKMLDRMEEIERQAAKKAAKVTAPEATPKKRKTRKRKTEHERYMADVKAGEEEFNARRQKEAEEATARCNHVDPKNDDCLICFPVDDQPTPPVAAPKKRTKKLPETKHFRIEANGKRGGAFAYNIISKKDGFTVVWRGEPRGFGSGGFDLDFAKHELKDREFQYVAECEGAAEDIELGHTCDHGTYYHNADGEFAEATPHSINPDCKKCTQAENSVGVVAN